MRHNLRMPPTFDTDPSRPPALAEAVGGPLGMAETSLPAVAFIVAYGVSGSNTDVAAAVAVGLALLLAIARLVKRESPRHALSGLLGVGIAAFIAARSGRAEDFFLPGLLLNAAYAAAFVVSILARRPLVGLIVGQLDGSGRGWHVDSSRLGAFTRASWMWAGLFLVRLAVQVPLYLSGAVVALGIARTAMGLPLFALGIWLTWLMVRRAPTRSPASA